MIEEILFYTMVLTAIGFLWLWYIEQRKKRIALRHKEIDTSVTRNPALWFAVDLRDASIARPARPPLCCIGDLVGRIDLQSREQPGFLL
ncbi:hypothetical protein [Bradyrhizobium sp. Arg816]|uniref:hypothetical protein n=1 Tax=Bradyrhizobium sp. Arg816 TaxID=2998491 RepID=UPI00249F098B|nr:hypothetical protein [Bradyrhizobium sp. Arg816]MDI3562430.1 hypothetical protein [Bradyrhizobium sp. Arg816]